MKAQDLEINFRFSVRTGLTPEQVCALLAAALMAGKAKATLSGRRVLHAAAIAADLKARS